MTGDDGPELTLDAVVRGETAVRPAGVILFVPARVVMGLLAVPVLLLRALGVSQNLPGTRTSVPGEWTIYPVALGVVCWWVGAVVVLAGASTASGLVLSVLAVGWVGTLLAVALDMTASEGSRPRLDRATYLLALAVPATTGAAGAVYLSGRVG